MRDDLLAVTGPTALVELTRGHVKAHRPDLSRSQRTRVTSAVAATVSNPAIARITPSVRTGSYASPLGSSSVMT